jgi:hypothetical protein
VTGALRVYYSLFSDKAGASRKMVLHATDADTARRMAWAAHEGAQQHWDVTVIEATSFATLEVAK